MRVIGNLVRRREFEESVFFEDLSIGELLNRKYL
jgi:hypothetical protein